MAHSAPLRSQQDARRHGPGWARAQHGLTLVEVCVVVMVLGILATAAAPSMTNSVRLYRLNGATRMVWGDLHRARMLAIKENRAIRLDFTATSYTLVRDDTNQVAFTRTLTSSYPGVTLTPPGTPVIFGSAGMLTTGTAVQVSNTGGTKSITILATGQLGTPL